MNNKKLTINIEKVKISVAAPSENIAEIRNAMCEAGAGIIGDYDCCSNSYKVAGTFRPNEKANPYVGDKNQLNFVDEEKLEVVCDINKAKSVISALRKAHPYEEPATEITPLLDENLFES
ncbi:NGG1p interacting factor NIF3 [Candidatus Saccharibacteria bacterium]|nr:NGG1p interacting factor NIF3 [Candidatus Saccharibacteria bacterium]